MPNPTGKLKFAYDTIIQLEAKIASLQSQMAWIDANERLPEKDGVYLIWRNDDWYWICAYDTERGFHMVNHTAKYWKALSPPEVKP